MRSYDLDGKLLWSLRGMSGIAIPTPFAGDGLVFVSSGYVGDKLRPLYAIRPGASGDITLKPGETSNEFIAWSNPVGGPYNPSPLLYEGRVYVLYDRGLVSCYDAKTGQVLYDRERLPEGFAFTSSPWRPLRLRRIPEGTRKDPAESAHSMALRSPQVAANNRPPRRHGA